MVATALVHDWLVSQRGGEHVLQSIAERFPDAPIHTLVHQPGTVASDLEAHPIVTSFIQHLPGAPVAFRRWLPLFPSAIERFDLSAYDLVISTSHCVAHGVRTTRDQRHISYIHTPMRYVWDQLPAYVPNRMLVPLARAATAPLRRWDRVSARRPDLLVANSAYVAARIKNAWGRESVVVHPPVDVAFYAAAPAAARRGYLAVGALVPYKRLDLAVRAARELALDLTVIGDGPERPRLEKLGGPTVRFMGAVDRTVLRDAFARAEALFYCGEEDFGIVLVEAMAAGCPVIALAAGGALETVVEGVTGTFFHRLEPAALGRAIDRCRAVPWDPGAMRAAVQRFRPERFREQLDALIDATV